MPTKITVHELKKFSNSERLEFMEAIDYLEAVLNDNKFKERFLALKLTNVRGMTHEQIYNRLMSGATDLQPEADFEIDIQLEMFFSYKNTVGYTRPSTIWTWINRKFFRNYSIADIAKNVSHESMGHKAGFDHKSAKETTSVPYNLGYLVRDMINEALDFGEPLPLAEARKYRKRSAIYA